VIAGVSPVTNFHPDMLYENSRAFRGAPVRIQSRLPKQRVRARAMPPAMMRLTPRSFSQAAKVRWCSGALDFGGRGDFLCDRIDVHQCKLLAMPEMLGKPATAVDPSIRQFIEEGLFMIGIMIEKESAPAKSLPHHQRNNGKLEKHSRQSLNERATVAIMAGRCSSRASSQVAPREVALLSRIAVTSAYRRLMAATIDRRGRPA